MFVLSKNLQKLALHISFICNEIFKTKQPKHMSYETAEIVKFILCVYYVFIFMCLVSWQSDIILWTWKSEARRFRREGIGTGLALSLVSPQPPLVHTALLRSNERLSNPDLREKTGCQQPRYLFTIMEHERYLLSKRSNSIIYCT